MSDSFSIWFRIVSFKRYIKTQLNNPTREIQCQKTTNNDTLIHLNTYFNLQICIR
jgi:hypothetical protein